MKPVQFSPTLSHEKVTPVPVQEQKTSSPFSYLTTEIKQPGVVTTSAVNRTQFLPEKSGLKKESDSSLLSTEVVRTGQGNQSGDLYAVIVTTSTSWENIVTRLMQPTCTGCSGRTMSLIISFSSVRKMFRSLKKTRFVVIFITQGGVKISMNLEFQ